LQGHLADCEKKSIIDFYANERIIDLDLNKCLLNIHTLVNDLNFFQNTGLHSLVARSNFHLLSSLAGLIQIQVTYAECALSFLQAVIDA